MARTFLELREEALHDDFDAAKYGERAARWINDAQQRVFRRVAIPDGELTTTIAVTAGDTTYDLPTGIVRLLSLYDAATQTPLVDTHPDLLEQLPTSTGKPHSFAFYGSDLTLYPTPQQAITLTMRYRGMPDLMAADGDLPLLPDEYSDLLVTYARGRLFRAEDDIEMATFYKAEFEEGIREMASDFGARNQKRVTQVPSMWETSTVPRFVRP